MIVWIDLETTGLEHDGDDAILEVAAIATLDNLEEIGRFHAVTNVARERAFASLNAHVQDMHIDNGLWVESLRSTLAVRKVGLDLREWIIEMRGPNGAKPILGGSGVHFDRAFLRRHMREAHDVLHYRNLDTTAFYETARRFWPDVVDKWPVADGAHRAMSDIETSIAVYRYFLDRIGPMPAPGALIPNVYRVDVPAVPLGPVTITTGGT